MVKRWVVNASPLIVLAKIGQVELLTALADEITVPNAVVKEISAGPLDDPDDYRIHDNIVRDALAQTVGEQW